MITNSLWVEKHRPKVLEDLVLKDEYRREFKKHINNGEIPHLLLHGKPGGGKTALAQIITSKLGVIQNYNYNVLCLNGSAQDSRGISVVTDIIEPFLRIPPAGNDKIKIVHLEEVDQLTDAAQKALRVIIEKYSATGRFLGTCNYISKIEDALLSRFTVYTFEQLPVSYVMEFCGKILTTEGIEFSEEDLKYIIDSFYPDIRKIISTLQTKSGEGRLIVDRQENLNQQKYLETLIVEIMDILFKKDKNKANYLNSNMGTVIKLIEQNEFDYRALYFNLFTNPNTPIPAKALINKYANSFQSCLIPQMHTMAMISEIVLCLKKYGS